MHQKIRKGPYFMNSSSSDEYLIFFMFMPMSTIIQNNAVLRRLQFALKRFKNERSICNTGNFE
jgi:hypothetical protein